MDVCQLHRSKQSVPQRLYPLSNIDSLVDEVSDYQLLNFMDAYLGYNQIEMHPDDEDKMVFIVG